MTGIVRLTCETGKSLILLSPASASQFVSYDPRRADPAGYARRIDSGDAWDGATF